MPSSETPTAFTGRDALTIGYAFAHFPFSGELTFLSGGYDSRTGSVSFTADEIVERIDALAAIISDYVERADANESELVHLRNDLAAVRRVFGADR